MIASTLATVALVVNELMASNAGVVLSPAVNYDSWIEFYNPGTQAVTLGGMYLSDDATDLRRWQLPVSAGSIAPGGFKVVWLGSHDIKATQAPFKLDCDGGTVYLSDADGQLVLAQTYPAAMSRTAWARTTDGGEQWGWTADATPGATNATAAFAEERLEAPVVSKGSCLFNNTLHVSVDIPEGAILMYTTDGSVPTAAPSGTETASPWTEYVVNGDCEGTDATCLVSRDANSSTDARRIIDGVGYNGSRGIRIHASATAQNDHDAQFFVYTPGHIWRSGEKYRFSMKVRADKATRIAAQTHTTPHNYIHWQVLESNYNITTQWQEITYEGTITDEQVGKQTDWWTGATQEKDMQTIAFNLNIDRKDNNIYFDDVSWQLFNGDGAVNGVARQSKDGQFTFSNTTNLCVRLFRDGYLPSVPVTRSYIKTAHQYTLPIVSIVGDKRDFTDPKTGFDCDGDGTNGQIGNGQDLPRNYNMDWDRPVNFSLISADGEMLFNQDVNICVSGGWTRSQRYRSFKLKSNKVFDGQNRFDYSFFPQKPYIRNKTLVVRNGGNDVWSHNARFLDPALQTIVQRSGMDIDLQSYVPVIEYVNGQLRGVFNLREPNNDKFAYANFGYDDEELDAFENDVFKNGDDKVWKHICDLASHINDEGAYDELLTLLDIDEYINYMVVCLYLDNTDWPDNNVKAYRSRNDGRYRFVLFDLDYAFDGRNRTTNENSFSCFTQFRNLPFVRLFTDLLVNDRFRRQFIDTFCVMAGSVFDPDLATTITNELLSVVRPMTQLMKQQGINDGHDPDRAANTLKNKLRGRSDMMTNHLKQYAPMRLSSVARQSVTLSSDTEGAHLSVNGIDIPYATFKGSLFAPVTLRAEAPAGYRFAGWVKGTTLVSTEEEMALPAGTVTLKATFVPVDEPLPPVRINEVSAGNGIHVNEYFKRNDWVELYNTTDQPVDVEGMYLSDNPDTPQKYRIAKPSVLLSSAPTVIPAHGHLVVWCDKLEPLSQLHASFKLSDDGGDVLLTAADESWTDRLSYGAMKSDETAGRYPDGCREVITMNVPTICQSNRTSTYAVTIVQPDVSGISDLMADDMLGLRYRNGALLITAADDGAVSVTVSAIDGRRVFASTASVRSGLAQVDLASLSRGTYVATVTDGHGRRAVCKFTASR